MSTDADQMPEKSPDLATLNRVVELQAHLIESRQTIIKLQERVFGLEAKMKKIEDDNSSWL